LDKILNVYNIFVCVLVSSQWVRIYLSEETGWSGRRPLMRDGF